MRKPSSKGGAGMRKVVVMLAVVLLSTSLVWAASEFTLGIWTRKVETAGVEVKGVINEIELLPGAKADWYFVPIRTGEYEMACEIEGHKEAGMVGKIIVK